MSINTEECYIRTILHESNNPLAKASLHSVDPSWFKSSAARMVIGVMRGLSSTGVPITPGSIMESAYLEPDVTKWLMRVADQAFPPGDIQKLAHAIKAEYANTVTQRKIIDIASSPTFSLARSGSELLRSIGSGMAMSDPGRLRIVSLEEALDVLDDNKPLVDRERSKNKMVTGIDACDSVVRMGAGRLGIVAAINSAGKSSFMTQAAVMTAAAGGSALLVSLEMSHEEVQSRAIANMTGVTSWDIYSKGLSGGRTTSRMREIAANVRTMSPGSGQDWAEMEAAIRNSHQEHPFDLVIIDYFQLMSPPDMHRNSTRAQEMGEMSKAAKRMAQDLGICVVLISQFNREVAEGVEPKIDMLRDTGQLENDCDFALLMWTMQSGEVPEGARLIGCRIAKNRGGEKNGLFHMFFMPATSRYREATT